MKTGVAIAMFSAVIGFVLCPPDPISVVLYPAAFFLVSIVGFLAGLKVGSKSKLESDVCRDQ
jgi:hypothetical protein